MKHLNIIGVLLLLLFSACGPDPQEARQAARDALDNASIQLDLGNKMEAMRLFKEAERYGLWADDTLTVAHARFNIASNLGYYANKEEIVSLLKAAAEGFGVDYVDRAYALRELGDFYQFHRAYDTAEMVLNQALAYAEKSGSVETKSDVFSAFYAMYFNAGEYEKSAESLRKFMQVRLPNMNDNLWMFYYHGMGNVLYELGDLDSTAYYYGKLEELVNQMDSKDDTWFYYGDLAGFAEERGDFETAYNYFYQYETGNVHAEIERRENNLALISHQYDNALIQNELNENIIMRQ
jgi:tetratricopeptide (TPR) repeat protein